MTVSKELLIHAIIGKGFIDCEEAETFTLIGLAAFTGNQHNPDWKWDRVVLDKLDEATLERVYNREEIKSLRWLTATR